MNLNALLVALQKDEGRNVNVRGRHLPYRCHANKLTIGYGRNIEDNGIAEEEAYDLLLNDAIQANRDAASLIPNWLGLDDGTRAAFQVKVGNTVLFTSYAGTEIKVDGETMMLMDESEVLAILD